MGVCDALSRHRRQHQKGAIGERWVDRRLRKSLDPSLYHVLSDLTLPSGDFTTQIDHVVASPFGIFVIETKNYKGLILGRAEAREWTKVMFKNRYAFQNPLHQNYKHTKTLSELTGISHDLFISVVVFVGDCHLHEAIPENVLHGREILPFIAAHTEHRIKVEQVPEVVEAFSEWANTVTREKKRAHVANLKVARSQAHIQRPLESCPQCGNRLVARKNGKTDQAFWGCISYPRCRYTRSVG
ncbi:MAG: restriction system protein [Kiritimatiellia bacterium]